MAGFHLIKEWTQKADFWFLAEKIFFKNIQKKNYKWRLILE